MHIACEHNKVNDALLTAGYTILPCPLARESKNSQQKQISISQLNKEVDGDGEEIVPKEELD